ncbi:MAG TPA: ABC transporter ATP-binding protein [Tepidisphaeraceae bacterium]|jgi:ABC-2 type transport system ATP-binding protein|nr:ABC transporter ATP-binding protein [Tepidisphaeraceae bacterium]
MRPAADGYVIDLQNVTKIYRRRVHALQGVSMQVRRGEIFGLLGPNGAGKSTLVKIMVTVVRPTSARGMILGHPIGHKPTLARVGYLPENHRFPKYLTGRQVIEFFSALANMNRPTRQRRASELLDLVGMTEWANTKISQYSKGMLQRVGLAQALGANPDLIILDEPTDGVDPGGRRDIRQVLLRLREQGATVFINSHLLSELESVCDRVAILVGGKVARQGSVDEMTIAKQCYCLELESPAWPAVAGALAGVFDPTAAPVPGRPVRGSLADKTWCEFDGAILRVGKTDPASVQPIIDALRKANLVIRAMQLVRPSLEDLFFEAVTDPTTGRTTPPGARPPPLPRNA